MSVKSNAAIKAKMTEVSVDQLKQAVESQHGGTATFVQAVPVHETHEGQTVWDGVVHVFDLKGSPTHAFRAYAWSYERDDGKRRFFAVLHVPPITGPSEAVQAAVVAEAKAERCEKCQGTGRIAESRQPRTYPPLHVPEKCPGCNGTGKRRIT
jgi:hypothetical protein